ncbi:MAG: hypothetical protein A3E64_01550 [Candidatus Harrisonbacteria bacterium RIFCSPHIGHO2_12_FULL_48_16]|uniref:50S ribosomal protein L35 n=1 Tax=Candidatus Harrisonbacteria bacterium RIFCSPHIGHO2_12_FULL_48_16 TaxID=1798405 RepID=A0A1G1ZMY2_9BACT|nr:MAG: hypothetical protein A3E64_01550 [Candidatus Harrisonbacteria bacterium RIFCSPHIGHO2_12_FULL_48_16]
MSRNSVASRIRVTKTGKLIKRTMGQGHCRAKKNARQLHRKGDSLVSAVDRRMFRKYISF